MAIDTSTSIGEDGGAEISIDSKYIEEIAKQYDFTGRDLMVHIDFEFKKETQINFITIDPILFGTSSFIEITDVATTEPNGEFKTVDGFENQSFDKILTPEANKVVSEDIVNKTLAPSQFSYSGKGIFTFPVRNTFKLRVTLLMKSPVPAPYERLHVLLQEIVTETTKVKKTKKSLF